MDRLNPKANFEIKSFGCKVNTYDAGLLEGRLQADPFLETSKDKIYIYNTCAVTGEATKETVREIRRLKKNEPNAKIVVTGCGAQVDTAVYDSTPEIDLIVANSHKGKLEEIVQDFFSGATLERTHKSNIFRKEDLEAGGGIETHHTRSFLKIQDGCNSFCSYCVIPFARGTSRSTTIADIVQRINDLSQQGMQEVVLTGIHIGDYEDKDLRLVDLVEHVLQKTNIPRIRLTSLEPKELSPRLLKLYANERLCAHFHMSIQSAESKILSEMKRNYTAQDVVDSLKNISECVPNAFVGMDVIVGFPGESEVEFLETFTRLEKSPWTKIHVFPYSIRPGTKASRIEGHLPQIEIQRRADVLRKLSLERYSTEALKQVGHYKKVLPLNHKKLVMGLSRDYWKVQLTSAPSGPQEINVKIIGYDHSQFAKAEGLLVGEIVSTNSH